MLLVIIGNPADGFEYIGPFTDHETASEYADSRDDSDWWVVPLKLPVAITCERNGAVTVVHRTATISEAEAWIADGLADGFLDENDVDQGLYGIDAPEGMINPSR
jgi:hypothetical protein